MTKYRGLRSFSLGRFVVFATLGFAVCFYGGPLLWLINAASRSEASLLSDPPFALGSWEALTRTWGNLTSYNDFQIGTWALNSLVYAVGGVLLSLIASVPAGYTLATSEFRGRKLILVATLVAMITPNTAVALPIFLEMNLIGLNNTHAGLILASGFFPFGVYLSYVYFATSLPKGVLEAGVLDGCSNTQLFTKIALPLAQPLVALVAFFSFVAIWSNYFLALVLLSDDKLFNLPVGLAALVGGSGALSNLPSSDTPIRKPEVLLAAILVVLPVLVVFTVAQRFVREGLLAGAEKT